ncbi:hypothetical protein MASR1M68_14370 [Elusimicrobiota bacterium]
MKKLIFFTILATSLFLSKSTFAQEINAEQNLQTNTTSVPAKINAKGIHITSFAVGSKNRRDYFDNLFEDTELNTAVIDVKEIDGAIGIRGVYGDLSFSKAVPNIENYVKHLKEKNIYTIARIVVFRDNVMPRKRPDLAVKTPEGELWEDYKNITWLDPYNQDAKDYVLDLAEKTADIGFDEIQFDYIRFPSDGNTRNCRYKVPRSSTTAYLEIIDFLDQAKSRLGPKGIKTSIDVFGLTTTETTDMGIGQKIVEMAEHVDYVSPMIYPSHYNKGEYGIPDPNKEPYRTVYIALQGAKKRIPVEKIRPWLQDFSMKGVKYGPQQIQEQIQACFDSGIVTWMLWNASCRYTKDGLKQKGQVYKKSSKETIDAYLKKEDVNEAMKKRALKQNTTSKNTVKKSTQTVTKKQPVKPK